MKNAWFIVALLLAALSCAPQASAFSTEQAGPYQNSDGSSKFDDPDEQSPNFIARSNDGGAGNGPLSFGHSDVTVPRLGDNGPGAQAFDRAYAHQQDQE